jgi:hypothetical protein
MANLGSAAAGRDASLFQSQAGLGSAGAGALASLGSANQMALGNVGAAQQASLANQSIAAANAYGQMATGMYNMHGQLGNAQAAAAAAEAAAMGNAAAAQQAAGPQYARMNLLSQVMPELLNTFRGGLQGSPAGGVGFEATGPEGLIASGSGPAVGGLAQRLANVPAGAFSGQFSAPDLPDFSRSTTASRDAMDALIENSNARAGEFRGDLAQQFNANRDATMSPAAMNAIGSAAGQAYGNLSPGANAGQFLGALQSGHAADRGALQSGFGSGMGALQAGLGDGMAVA